MDKRRLRLSSDTVAITALAIGCAVLFGQTWLRDHPEANPWAQLSLAEPEGWATSIKWQQVRDDAQDCRDALARSSIVVSTMPPVGEGQCRREDRQTLAGADEVGVTLIPIGAQATCAVDLGMARWLLHGVQPAARLTLGSEVTSVEHLGTANCRRIGNSIRWSEHSRGNAIDISGFVLADGRRITVRRDWTGSSSASVFLHAVRDAACNSFGTVLSPDYNAAHADHLHLDQARRAYGWSTCR